MSLLQMSVTGAVMILAITVIRAITINKVPKNTFLVLWGIALVRLLIPFSFPSCFSIYSLLEQKAPAIAKTSPAISLLPFPLSKQLAAAPHNTSVFTAAVSVWAIVWAAGALICTMVFVLIYWKCHKEFLMSFPVANAFAKQWLQDHQLKRSISIRQSGLILAPLTFGVWRPVILMPKKTDWKNENMLQYVLEHEFIHIRSFDVTKKLLLIIAVCVHWFNPLVWVMYILANRDIELSCDEAVVHRFGSHTKAAYAKILISMEEMRSVLTPLCSNFSRNAIEERITAIMKIKKATTLSLITASALVIGTVTVFATSAQAGANKNDILPKNQAASSWESETASGFLTSYTDEYGQTRYLLEEGNTTRILSEEELQQQNSPSDIEWWTYEEYKHWLEIEKLKLQEIIGEKAWTSGQGNFVWTQELVDETIAAYEEILGEIKNGAMVSKTVDGSMDDFMISYVPGSILTTREYQLCIKLDNGDEKTFGPYKTAKELLAAVKPFCDQQVQLGNMQQSEADEIIDQYTNN